MTDDEGSSSRWALSARLVLAVLVAVGVAGAWLTLASTTYQASSEVYVKTGPPDPSTQGLTGIFQQNRAQTYAVLAHGNLVLGEAIKASGVDISVQRLNDETSVQVLPQTIILQITVADEDPRLAETLSDAVAEALVTEGNRIETAGNSDLLRLVVVDRARLPTKASSPDRPRIIVLSLLLGILAALAVPSLRGIRFRAPARVPEHPTAEPL